MRSSILVLLFVLVTAVRAEPPTHHYAAGQLPPLREVAPTELFRVGGFDDEFLLGVISAALVDADGNVYLLDQQLSEIPVFDPDGNHLRTIGRDGEGPGEFRRGGDMFWVDGNLCVVQRFPGRLVMFTPEGDPAGDLVVDGVQGMGGVQAAQIQGGVRVFAKASGRRTDDGFVFVQTLATHDARGAELSVLDRMEFERNMAANSVREDDMVFLENPHWWAVTSDGTVALGRELDDYRLQFKASDGSERGVTTLEYRPLARTKAELDEVRSRPRMMMRGGRRGGGPEFVARENHPVFAGIRVGPDGKLWVLSARGARPSDPGIFAQYEVFATDGKLVDRVAIRAEGNARDDAAFFGPDHIIVVRGYRDAQRAFSASFGGSAGEEDEELEPEPLEIVVYRL